MLELDFFIGAENPELMVKTVSGFWSASVYIIKQTNKIMLKSQGLKLLKHVNKHGLFPNIS